MDEDGKVDELVARPYQAHLEEIGYKKNIIINLPTGSGKTCIAMALIKRFRKDLQKPWGHGGKRTFFLVNNVPLVEQQKKVIEYRCPVEGVGGYSSEDKVDFWQKPKWDSELEKHQVIVMTSQILSDMLTHQYIRVEDINLIVFDECHHAVLDHPMRMIMKQFVSCPIEKQPRVIGLTATLLNSNANSPDKIEEALKSLENTFHAKIASVNNFGEVLEYSTNPKEMIVTYSLPKPTNAGINADKVLMQSSREVMAFELPKIHDVQVILKRNQQDITTDPNKIKKEVKNMLESMASNISVYGVFGGSLSILAYSILLERLKRKASTKEEAMLYKVASTQAFIARDMLEEYMENDHGYKKIVRHSSDQFLKLLNILKEYNPDVYKKHVVSLKYNQTRSPLSCIIFTQQRFAAKILFNLLKEVVKHNPDEFGFLKHDFIVGSNINPYKNTREQYFTKKQSQIALLKFKNGDLNCLISTSVVEEGIDIPQCQLVIRYDSPLEYRSYIQSKGRARSSEANYIMMIEESTYPKFKTKHANYGMIENYLQKVITSTNERVAPTREDIEEDLYFEDEIPPYCYKTGARLSSIQAISLLSRYCTTLPHDGFTTITPSWISEKFVDKKGIKMKKIIIYMPLSCPVKEAIHGAPSIQLKTAKRSAALNACIRLHQVGELLSDTMLPRTYCSLNFEQVDIKQCFPNWPWDEKEDETLPKPGTKKRKRKHRKVFPACLNGSSNWKNGAQNFYLHVVQTRTTFPKPVHNHEATLFDFLQSEDGYGFLTSNPLPELCTFSTFLKLGELTTSLEVNHATLMLDMKTFEAVKRFHFFVYNQVLGVAKKYLVFDGTQNAMYTVPLKKMNGDCEINWDMVNDHTEVKPVDVPSVKERQSLNITRSGYMHSVVTPWYRSNIYPDRYIVTNVLEYKTPYSQFPTNVFDSYADYYAAKHNLEIVGEADQPLLEVTSITTGMNCLLPRGASIHGLTDKQKKLAAILEGDARTNKKDFDEVFVAEYCIKYEFPGHMWYKALMLPSICHRVFYLLIANELRLEIAKDTKIGCKTLSYGDQWQPVEVNKHKARTAVLSQVETPNRIKNIDRMNVEEEGASDPVKTTSMRAAVYQLVMKKISKDYPWDEDSEPVDIDRNLSSVTVMDVEVYDKFVCAPLSTSPEHTPQHRPTTRLALPMYPIMKKHKQINLLKKEANRRGPELKDVLSAITLIKSHDTFDLERTETLGDSFLKFAATLYLYHKFTSLNEGQLTNIKGRLIGNRNLYYAGERVNLGGRMKVEIFAPRKDFLVPGFFAPMCIQKDLESLQLRPTFLIGLEFSQQEALSGVITKKSINKIKQRFKDQTDDVEKEPIADAEPAMQNYVRAQAVSDKSVADCVESLIGTYLLSSGIEGGVRILEWLRVFPKTDDFMQHLHKRVPTPLSEKKTTLADIDFLLDFSRQEVEAKIGYTFKDPSFLLEALTHPSYIKNRLTRSYERLEFLGDAILDFLITSSIFENAGDLGPGDLTNLRSALVNNVTFASYVVKLGLHKYMCCQMSPALDGAILSFVVHQTERDHKIVEDVLYLIDENDTPIAEYVEVPKALSDLFESLVGAVFLDSGGDLDTVWRVVYDIMYVEIAKFTSNIPKQPVQQLYEAIHVHPVFGKADIPDPDTQKVFLTVTITKDGKRIKVTGKGNNKFQAKRAAAKLALKLLNM